MSDISRHVAERDAALTNMDLDRIRRMSPYMANASDGMMTLVAHKARYECTSIARELRLESAEWLRARGHGRLTGDPLLPQGELPE